MDYSTDANGRILSADYTETGVFSVMFPLMGGGVPAP
jgi:hypothetical protein